MPFTSKYVCARIAVGWLNAAFYKIGKTRREKWMGQDKNEHTPIYL